MADIVKDTLLTAFSQKKKVDDKSFGAKFKSKREVYKYVFLLLLFLILSL